MNLPSRIAIMQRKRIQIVYLAPTEKPCPKKLGYHPVVFNQNTNPNARGRRLSLPSANYIEYATLESLTVKKGISNSDTNQSETQQFAPARAYRTVKHSYHVPPAPCTSALQLSISGLSPAPMALPDEARNHAEGRTACC
jgi:hypothetical protein